LSSIYYAFELEINFTFEITNYILQLREKSMTYFEYKITVGKLAPIFDRIFEKAS